jgi:AcrR family transcriptional regulator
MRRTKEDAEQTRKSILASALDLLYEKGYSKTTFDEIAKRINLTKGAVYWYFRNKPDIVAALIKEFAAHHLQLMQNYIKEKKDVSLNDLIEMEIFNINCIKEHTNVYKFIFFVSCQMEWSEAILTKIRPQLEETMQNFLDLYIAVLEKLKKEKKIRPDTDIRVVYELLEAVKIGLMQKYLAKRLVSDYEKLIRIGYNLIFDSIKTEGINNENQLS